MPMIKIIETLLLWEVFLMRGQTQQIIEIYLNLKGLVNKFECKSLFITFELSMS